MYDILLVLHTYVRRFVLASLLFTVYRAYKGWVSKEDFTKRDNALRHWTATIAHIQMVIGIVLYFKSPVTKNFWANFKTSTDINTLFFGIIHILLMLTAIVLITIGSAMAKRKLTHQEKFRTMLIWFSIALAIIFLAIPWPFSPIANRPYDR